MRLSSILISSVPKTTPYPLVKPVVFMISFADNDPLFNSDSGLLTEATSETEASPNTRISPSSETAISFPFEATNL